MASAPPLKQTACVVHYENCHSASGDVGRTWNHRILPPSSERSGLGSYRVHLPKRHLTQSWDDSLTTPHRYSSLKPNTAVIKAGDSMPSWTSPRHRHGAMTELARKSQKCLPVLSSSIPCMRSTGAKPGDTSLTTNAEILDSPSWNVHLNAWVSSNIGQSNTYVTIAERQQLIDRGIYNYMPEYHETPHLPCPRYVEHMHNRPILRPIPTGRRKRTPEKTKFWKWKGRTEPVIPWKLKPAKVEDDTSPIFPPISPSPTRHTSSPISPPSTTSSTQLSHPSPTPRSTHFDGTILQVPPSSPIDSPESCDLSPDVSDRHLAPSAMYQESCPGPFVCPPTPAPSIASESSPGTTPDNRIPPVLSEHTEDVSLKTSGKILRESIRSYKKLKMPSSDNLVSFSLGRGMEENLHGRPSSAPVMNPFAPYRLYCNSQPSQDPSHPSVNPFIGHMTQRRMISSPDMEQGVLEDDEHLCGDSDYGSIRSGETEKVSSVSLRDAAMETNDDFDNQSAPLYQPSSGQTPNNQWNAAVHERAPSGVYYHLDGPPKTASSMDWETAGRLSDLDSGHEDETVFGVSPSMLERMFFSNDYIEILEVPTYGHVEYFSSDLYRDSALVPGAEVIVKKCAPIEPPDRLVVSDMVIVHCSPSLPIPVPEVPALPPPKEPSPPPTPPEPTPTPVRELTPPPMPVTKPKERQIVKKEKSIRPPPRVKPNLKELTIASSSPSDSDPVVDPTEPPPGVPEGDENPLSPSSGTECQPPESCHSSEEINEKLQETPQSVDEVPLPPEDDKYDDSREGDDTPAELPGMTERDSSSSPTQSSLGSQMPSCELPTETPEVLPSPDPLSPVPLTDVDPAGGPFTPEEGSPHPPRDPSPLPEAQKDPGFLAERERERLAEERRAKAYDMFEMLKTKRFIPVNATTEAAAKIGAEHKKIHSYDGWLAQFFIVKEDKAKMYQQVFEVVDEDGDGYLSCFETLMALKGITGAHELTEQEVAYIIRVLELADYPVSQGTDLRLFSILASLSQRILSVDTWVRNLINNLDLTSLEWKITRAKELFEWCLEGDSHTLHVDRLILDLRAGGVSQEHQEEVRSTLGSKGSWDMIDFFSYLPLFIMTHESVVANPLDDSQVK